MPAVTVSTQHACRLDGTISRQWAFDVSEYPAERWFCRSAIYDSFLEQRLHLLAQQSTQNSQQGFFATLNGASWPRLSCLAYIASYVPCGSISVDTLIDCLILPKTICPPLPSRCFPAPPCRPMGALETLLPIAGNGIDHSHSTHAGLGRSG
ncbi:hypothetical protein N656DRAFT_581517 [Canariomyces notabilis]|uniref:Uncharacterized protein n=1 Tax=Canariomyces notabilis TaxID=2074819 RepID=A0AAN6TH20_9PEZI|nr:hypothetical protein N656DRAFT_581517 [Canariomyces arenarius]